MYLVCKLDFQILSTKKSITLKGVNSYAFFLFPYKLYGYMNLFIISYKLNSNIDYWILSPSLRYKIPRTCSPQWDVIVPPACVSIIVSNPAFVNAFLAGSIISSVAVV